MKEGFHFKYENTTMAQLLHAPEFNLFYYLRND